MFHESSTITTYQRRFRIGKPQHEQWVHFYRKGTKTPRQNQFGHHVLAKAGKNISQ